MVTVRVSETYDLSTKVGKMGIVGIHTPRGQLISKLWGGLLFHYNKFRFVKCDVAMACASMLPADPLQIGVEAGDIAPEDMFNPILYKAVSNDSMNNFLNFVQSLRGSDSAAVDKGSVVDINDANFNIATAPIDQFGLYYGLLSDTSGWKKAMPQSGLTMRGLYPLVYQVLNSYGLNNAVKQIDINGTDLTLDDPSHTIPAPGLETGVLNTEPILPFSFRGRAIRMPAIDTGYYAASTDENIVSISMNGPASVLGDNTSAVPPAYVGLIVLPPARLSQLYYRLKVTWTVEFSGLRSLADITNWNNLLNIGNSFYGSDYEAQSTSMTSLAGMVDTDGADVKKIMEGV